MLKLLMTRRGQLLAAFFLGAITSLSQAPLSAWPVQLVSLPLLAWMHYRAPDPRASFWIGAASGFGYFICCLWWIGEAFLVEAEQFAWMLPFAVTLLPALLCLFWAGGFWVGKRLGGTPWALAFGWGGAEALRGYVLTGFPWGLFAYGWIETPLVQNAAHIGPYALNFLIILGIAGLGWALFRTGASRLLGAGGAFALLGMLAVAGWMRLPSDPLVPGEYVIRIVQPNVPQKEKWVPHLIEQHLRSLISLSNEPAAQTPDLIVWPETATVPALMRDPQAVSWLMDELPEGTDLVLGTQRIKGEGVYYNSLFLVGASGRIEAVYDKHHLVPFGEYLPLQPVLSAMGIRQLAGRSLGFATGEGPGRIAWGDNPSFGPLICYEAIFPQEMPVLGDRPEYLLQITNDAWFGESGGPYQHFVQARMRAIEQGLPFIRSANTGISGLIGPYGDVAAHIDLLDRGTLDVLLPPSLRETAYSRWGSVPFLLLLGLMAATFVVYRFPLRNDG
ncbi:MAG: apolipoprotein N-acyltransferase [Neomegalonema sp.]|nr:apolipoprotein N-acyltransferase [Neomegalonema sp.]